VSGRFRRQAEKLFAKLGLAKRHRGKGKGVSGERDESLKAGRPVLLKIYQRAKISGKPILKKTKRGKRGGWGVPALPLIKLARGQSEPKEGTKRKKVKLSHPVTVIPTTWLQLKSCRRHDGTENRRRMDCEHRVFETC